MRRTVLYNEHAKAEAKFLEFSGWQMPLQYTGILQEHLKTRQDVTLFDVSHMGRISITGSDAEKFLDFLSTNIITGKSNGSATYTVFCDELGGSVDDLIVFKENGESYFCIVNAGNRENDLAHMLKHSHGYRVQIIAHYDDEGIIAIQGPKAVTVVNTLFPASTKLLPMTFMKTTYKSSPIYIAATGYTGSGGFEIVAPLSVIRELWKDLLEVGSQHGIAEAGLGARDTLRLEMGYTLYGHELSKSISPTESVAAWAVKLSKPSFLGKEALMTLENSGHKRYPIALRMQTGGILREGLSVYFEGKEIGKITSGTYSPSLKCSIALALVDKKISIGQHLEVSIRGQKLLTEVVKLPFLNHK